MKLLEGENINYYTSNTSPITITKIAEHSTFFKVAEIEDAYCKYIYSADVTTSSPYINVEVIEKNQAIEIQSLNKLNFCPEESLILNFFSENSYSQYVVQLISGNTVYDLPATLVSLKQVSIQLPDFLKSGVKYQVRVKGVGNSTDYSFAYPYTIMIYDRPTGTLSGGGNISLNTSEQAELTFHLKGTSPWQVSYSNGDNNYTFYTSDSVHTLRVKPDKSANYFLTTVSNSCGSGEKTGNALVNVMNISTNHTVGPDGICYGQTLIVPFVSEGIYSLDNVFKIQLYRNDSLAKNISSNYYTLDAVYQGNALYTTLPNNLPFNTSNNNAYNIRVISTSPKILGTYAPNLTRTKKQEVLVWGEEPVITLTGNNTIALGDSINLKVNASGNSNFWYFRLNDGVNNFYYYPNSFPFEILKIPNTTTTYTIDQFYAACGGKIGQPSALTVNVNTCPESQIISTSITGDFQHFQAEKTIVVSSTVQSSANLTLNAGSSITLSPGFQTGTNVVFKAFIKGCND